MKLDDHNGKVKGERGAVRTIIERVCVCKGDRRNVIMNMSEQECSAREAEWAL